MSIELRIPEVGESITEVQIAKWLKTEGDAVQKDEPVAVIDSEKTTFELPAPESGTLGRILHQAGATVAVGELIAHLETGGGATGATEKPETNPSPQAVEDSKAPAKKATSPAGAENEQETSAETNDRRAESETTRVPTRPVRPESDRAHAAVPEQPDVTSESEATPAEAKVAERAKEEPASKPAGEPSPPVARKASSRSPDAEVEIVPMSMLRRTVARRLVEARQQMAMLTTFNEVDMSAVQSLRDEHKEAFAHRHGVKLGLMSFFVKATVDALKQFPGLNAEVRGNDIVYHNYFNIGVALATGRGLVVPVLNQAGRLSFADIEKTIGAFASRANDGQLKPDELEGATFTITNGGVFGSLLSTPIISPPQSGILGMHSIQERPIAAQGQVVIRPMMYLALSYDHRIVDGREAVLFLRRIKEVIETPARMLMEV